jgi:hypothetical protein
MGYTRGMATDSAIVMYADGNPVDVLRAYPVLDKPATRVLAERLFPGAGLEEIGDQLLADALNPPEHVAYIGCFPGLDLVCCWAIMPDRPSQLDPAVRGATERAGVFLHALHTDAGWCSFGIWQGGTLVRACSVCPDGVAGGSGVLEDEGEHLAFEREVWSEGPVALGQAALRALVGITLPADDPVDDVDAEAIPVVGYRVTVASVPAPPSDGVTLETASPDAAR